METVRRHEKRWMVVAKLISSQCDVSRLICGAELGVKSGRFTRELLSRFSTLHMTMVDCWESQPTHHYAPSRHLDKSQGGGWDHQASEQKARGVAARFHGRVTVLKGYTNQMAPHVKDASLDFVFIDADHSYDGCSADIQHWLPKVKPGGFISGHDIDWVGVEKAVCEAFGPNFTSTTRRGDAVWWHLIPKVKDSLGMGNKDMEILVKTTMENGYA